MENDWPAAVDRFAADLDADEKSPLTVRNYRRELRVFAGWYHATYQETPGVHDLTHEDMREYKDSLRDRKLEPATINLALAALRMLPQVGARMQADQGAGPDAQDGPAGPADPAVHCSLSLLPRPAPAAA